MDQDRLKLLIKQYEETYLYVTKRIETVISDKVMEMSLEQFGIIRQLALNGAMRPNELAKILGVHKSAITQKSDKLVEKGIIERKADSKDRRYLFLHLTPSGQNLYTKTEQAVTELIGSYLKELDLEEFEVFLKVYEKLNQIIQREVREENEK